MFDVVDWQTPNICLRILLCHFSQAWSFVMWVLFRIEGAHTSHPKFRIGLTKESKRWVRISTLYISIV
jgi:hypothetical protein